MVSWSLTFHTAHSLLLNGIFRTNLSLGISFVQCKIKFSFILAIYNTYIQKTTTTTTTEKIYTKFDFHSIGMRVSAAVECIDSIHKKSLEYVRPKIDRDHHYEKKKETTWMNSEFKIIDRTFVVVQQNLLLITNSLANTPQTHSHAHLQKQYGQAITFQCE